MNAKLKKGFDFRRLIVVEVVGTPPAQVVLHAKFL